MSIFGKRIAHPGPAVAGRGPNMVEVLSDYAKKDYVDAQDGLRVLKAGDMTGDLTMARGLIRGLPLTQPMGTTTNSDEAISSYHVIELINRALNADRDARRPLITVYAEEYGSLSNREFEWSFGNGVTGGNSARRYPLAASGRLLRMSLAITTSSSRPSEARVNIVVNGVENRSYGIIKPLGHYCGVTKFQTPLALDEGDMINFRSASTNSDVTSAVVACILELNIN